MGRQRSQRQPVAVVGDEAQLGLERGVLWGRSGGEQHAITGERRRKAAQLVQKIGGELRIGQQAALQEESGCALCEPTARGGEKAVASGVRLDRKDTSAGIANAPHSATQAIAAVTTLPERG